MAEPITMTDEAAQDFQALIAGLTVAEFKEMMVRTIRAADATSLRVVKEVRQLPDGGFDQVFTMLFNRPEDSEFK